MKALALSRPRSTQGDFAGSFTSLFSDPKSARDVGRRYLANHPQEADAQILRRSLFAESHSLHTQNLRADLARQRRKDFGTGNTVILDGWLLARSELRACALLALIG